MGPNPVDWPPYKRGKFEHRHMHTGRMPREEEGRNQGNSSVSQGTPKLASKPPGAMRQA